MKTNEEIIYTIIKKKVWILILVPLILTGAYFAYTRASGTNTYTASTTLLVNNTQDSSLVYAPERYTTITNALKELATSSMVLDKVTTTVSDLSSSEIERMLTVKTTVSAQAVTLTINSGNKAVVLPVINALAQSLQTTANEIYELDVVHIIDVPDGVSTIAPALSRTKLLGTFALSLIVTLFAVLGLSWKKESK